MERITATEAARKFSDILNRVRYQGASFEVMRGNEVVARIVPVEASTVRPRPLRDVAEAIAKGPRLDRDNALAWEEEINAIRAEMKLPEIKWE